jgi:hypothetical protein
MAVGAVWVGSWPAGGKFGRGAMTQPHVAFRRASLVPYILCATRLPSRRHASGVATGSVASFIDSAGYRAAKKQAVASKFPDQLPVEEYLARAGLLGRGVYVPGTPREPSAPVILDVRSPCEYSKGHIPGALLPLASPAVAAVRVTVYRAARCPVQER